MLEAFEEERRKFWKKTRIRVDSNSRTFKDTLSAAVVAERNTAMGKNCDIVWKQADLEIQRRIVLPENDLSRDFNIHSQNCRVLAIKWYLQWFPKIFTEVKNTRRDDAKNALKYTCTLLGYKNRWAKEESCIMQVIDFILKKCQAVKLEENLMWKDGKRAYSDFVVCSCFIGQKNWQLSLSPLIYKSNLSNVLSKVLIWRQILDLYALQEMKTQALCGYDQCQFFRRNIVETRLFSLKLSIVDLNS